MVEWRECFLHLVTVCKIFDKLREEESFHLLDIWAELPKDEPVPPAPPNCHDGGPGRPTIVSNNWGRVFKTNGADVSTLAPPQLLDLPGKGRTAELLQWELKDIRGDGRSMVLIFNKSILKQRGYKVALAFQFAGGHVLAFLSYDLLFQVKWVPLGASDIPSLIASHPDLCSIDVFHDFPGFLEALVDWIERRRRSGALRTGLACEIIRMEDGARRVWVGVGVYTVCEIFFLAGISIFLTEKEVFDNASRTARLANAYWQFAYNAQDLYITCISRCMVEDVLAPTKAQRKRYLRYLHVFRKQRTRLYARHADAVDKYNERLQQLSQGGTWQRDSPRSQLFDYFEPSLLLNALFLRTCHPSVDVRSDNRAQKSRHECRDTCKRAVCDMANKGYTLGGLSFGTEYWTQTAPQEILACEVNAPPLSAASLNPFALSRRPLPSAQESPVEALLDPLTASFDKEFKAGVITKHDRYNTFLPVFSEGILPEDHNTAKDELPYRTPGHYKIGGDPAYSIVRDFPDNSKPKRNKTVTHVVGKKACDATFEAIIKSDGRVAIGPLEYCGNGYPIAPSWQNICIIGEGWRSSPRLPSYLHARSALQRMATKTIREVERARERRVQQAASIKRMRARGKVFKGQIITITKAREKTRAIVRKDLEGKVIANKVEHNHDMGDPTGPSEASLVAAIPDLPTPAASPPPSPSPGPSLLSQPPLPALPPPAALKPKTDQEEA
ncbi:hypothetical protein NMY22_g15802 [Coprinellus aureogranulatus]|nr:hypothetical protein NMY22_g15802 [Coprinellus aureogranulatus]